MKDFLGKEVERGSIICFSYASCFQSEDFGTGCMRLGCVGAIGINNENEAMAKVFVLDDEHKFIERKILLFPKICIVLDPMKLDCSDPGQNSLRSKSLEILYEKANISN